jgi:hypothetical protein
MLTMHREHGTAEHRHALPIGVLFVAVVVAVWAYFLPRRADK